MGFLRVRAGVRVNVACRERLREPLCPQTGSKRSGRSEGYSRIRDASVAMCWALSPPFCEVQTNP